MSDMISLDQSSDIIIEQSTRKQFSMVFFCDRFNGVPVAFTSRNFCCWPDCRPDLCRSELNVYIEGSQTGFRSHHFKLHSLHYSHCELRASKSVVFIVALIKTGAFVGLQNLYLYDSLCDVTLKRFFVDCLYY